MLFSENVGFMDLGVLWPLVASFFGFGGSGAALPRNFKWLGVFHVARRAGKGSVSASRVILLVAGGGRAGPGQQHNMGFFGGCSIIAPDPYIQFK